MAPTVILVPGICSVGSVIYAPLKEELHTAGFSNVICIDLPSVDCLSHIEKLTPNPLEADISQIRSSISKELEQGRDVILVAHSYGGNPTLYACNGFWKHDRASKGLRVGVVKVTMLSSGCISPGESAAGIRGGWMAENDITPPDQNAKIEMIGENPVLYPAGTEDGFFADMGEDEKKRWGETLRPTALGCLTSPAPEGNPKDWRITYLITEDLDPGMPEAFQRFLAAKTTEAGAVVDEIKYMKSGHFVQITHAKEIAEWMQASI